MTPAEKDNAIRAQGRKCVDEIRQAMKTRPKPKWNSVVPPILKKHHEKVKPMGISLVAFVSRICRMNGRYGVES
ncbi:MULTISPECIES: hypothetical protein [Enterobacter cloacae complex]|uniref:hypothetical protein n=1 Tax=Enterobacter cloacae complex TaxID=354276 RepID=UPI0012B98DCE|nr:hypothetical protein [Enterobacter hormaechei]EMD6795888.1 hypothetical protein [Enterobacter hormaechei subsp. steigerwaltii]MBT1783456.1 hypothetical protein [Enterobacter hormaechei subsp. xiangfangensis]EJR0237655.1 hypothetical protein [Enterobacter hormaechei]EKT9343967.1 hypothetical protein [Enterobacter hormaechei]EKT9370912.1 hypothetical protein [Enterobacter hormaechei]